MYIKTIDCNAHQDNYNDDDNYNEQHDNSKAQLS